MTIRQQTRWSWWWALPALLTGCRADPVTPDLAAVDAESRIAGIVVAAQANDPAHLPLLVEALEDDDAAVRIFAIEALERRTGQTHGYSPYAPPAERAEAVARWRAGLEELAPVEPPPVTSVAEKKEGAARK